MSALLHWPMNHHAPTTLAAMKAIKAAGGYVRLIPNLREEVWLNPADLKSVVLQAVALADVVKFSDDELLFLTDKADLQTALSWLAE